MEQPTTASPPKLRKYRFIVYVDNQPVPGIVWAYSEADARMWLWRKIRFVVDEEVDKSN